MPTAVSVKRGERLHRRWARTRQVLNCAFHDFLAEESLMVSGSIAYHSLLAIFPLLLLLLGLSGLYIRRYELAGPLAVALRRYLPIRADFILRNLVGISQAYGRIGLLSFLLLLWSSAGVFMPLERALNRAWEVTDKRPWWRSKLLALEMALIFGGLVLMSAALVAGEILFRLRLAALLGPSLHSLNIFLYHLLTGLTSFGVALAMFIILFERLPNRPMGVRQAFPGALLTTVLWETARWLFTLLLPLINYRHVYGSIAVMVSLMTWAYISSAVILFGAQVSRNLHSSFDVRR
jgi:YihY family inner membrane protein